MTEKKKSVVTVVSKITPQPLGQQACLVMIYGLDLGKKFNLDKPAVIIGRSPKCDIQVDQESISRNHAKIENTGEAVVLGDLGSTNGTYVNDKLIRDKISLRDGDLLKIGRTIFKFLSGGNLENAYHEEIYRLTTVDGLTQVYNKRHFMESLARELSRSRRYGRDLSLLIIDIDRFKSINDTYGHLAGDCILKEVATRIQHNIRREDFLARYGGEEFAIILPEIDHCNAMIMAEKVRRLIDSNVFTFEGISIPATISIGVGTAEGSVTEAIELIRLTDQNLYQAKKAGRNKVIG